MLIESVSGLRGIVGEDLTPRVIIDRVLSFLSYNGGNTYLLARDTRPHGKGILNIIKGTLNFYGINTLDADIIPTPTALLYIRDNSIDGGFVVTASHNPPEYNGIKYVTGEGLFPTSWEKSENVNYTGETGKDLRGTDVGEYHIRKIMSYYKGKSRTLRICVDTNNGAAYYLLPELLRRMGHEVVTLNTNPDGVFVHNPEPRKEHLTDLDTMLKEGLCDLGFGTDPDADRLICGVKRLGILSEEYTLPLALLGLSEKTDVVVNFSTSMLADRVVEMLGGRILKTKVGEANVVNKMIESDVKVGGEGNGGVIFSHINSARDSLVGSFYITQLAEREDLASLVERLPSFHMIKEKAPLKGNIPFEKLEEIFKADFMSREDGLYLEWEDAWLHIRKSNTEPIVRVYAEAQDKERAQQLVNKALSLIQ